MTKITISGYCIQNCSMYFTDATFSLKGEPEKMLSLVGHNIHILQYLKFNFQHLLFNQ